MMKYPHPSFSKPAAGFTLSELLVGILITAITLTLAGTGFVTLAQKSAKSDSEIDRRIDLNRAVEFMADEIREASSVSASAPPNWDVPANYTGILYLTRPSAPTTIAYYTRNSVGTGWRNQLVIYRATASGDLGQPLVDGLANASPGCSGGSSTRGFQVDLTTINRQVTLCLLGYVPGFPNLQVKGKSGPRACEGIVCSVGGFPVASPSPTPSPTPTPTPSPTPIPSCRGKKVWQDPPGKCVRKRKKKRKSTCRGKKIWQDPPGKCVRKRKKKRKSTSCRGKKIWQDPPGKCVRKRK